MNSCEIVFGKKYDFTVKYMKFKEKTLEKIADMVCGNFAEEESKFVYRSSYYLTKFFCDIDKNFIHDGSTRNWWVVEKIKDLLLEPQKDEKTPPDSFIRMISRLMDQDDATNERSSRSEALLMLNATLAREGFEAFYADDNECYLRYIGSSAVIGLSANPHRPFSPQELERREQLAKYLDIASEDELIEEVLLPLFRQLNFKRITAAGHKDKALEYGKDIWMKYVLPTQHILYFGIQAKKGKLDSSGVSRKGSANIAEIYNQLTMMIGHEIFDPEISRRVLVDHAFIIAGGEITKAARNWIGGKLDSTKRSQIMFMEREDILNLYVVTNIPLPNKAILKRLEPDDNRPF